MLLLAVGGGWRFDFRMATPRGGLRGLNGPVDDVVEMGKSGGDCCGVFLLLMKLSKSS
jgi:hypothetical protein